VLADGRAERLVVRHPRLVERGQVELDEALALRLGDPQPAVDVDEVLEAELAREAVRAAEGLGGEHREVLDVLRLPVTEQRLEERVAQDAVVEELLEAVQRGLASGVLVEARALGACSCRHAPKTAPGGPAVQQLRGAVTTTGCGTVVAWISNSRRSGRSRRCSTTGTSGGRRRRCTSPSRRSQSASPGWRPGSAASSSATAAGSR